MVTRATGQHKVDGELLFMEFDNAPEENQGDDEGRGFVEHEIAMIREKLEQLLDEPFRYQD